jgi:hypothetical protein
MGKKLVQSCINPIDAAESAIAIQRQNMPDLGKMEALRMV